MHSWVLWRRSPDESLEEIPERNVGSVLYVYPDLRGDITPVWWSYTSNQNATV